MATGHARGRKVAGLVLLLVLVGAELATPLQVLVVEPRRDPGAVVRVPLTDGAFEVRFVHSHAHFDVHEHHRVDDGRIVVVDQWVNGSGAGIDEVAGESQWVSAGNGWRHLPGLHRSLGVDVVLRVGHVADHRLVVGCRQLRLTDVSDEFAAVRLSVQPVGPLRWAAAALSPTMRSRPTLSAVACGRPGSQASSGP